MTGDKLPPWFEEFLKYNGVKEIKGAKHSAEIMMLLDAGDGKIDGKRIAGISDDETAYCSTALCGAMELRGIQSTRAANARSWMKWGEMLGGPAVGAIVVFWRVAPDSWQGHVGVVAGRTSKGNLIVYGANQDDQFKYSEFGIDKVLGYRWPTGYPKPSKIGLPKLPITSASPVRTQA